MSTSIDEEGIDESLQGVRCAPGPELTGNGWILMARYKHRGCTSSAIHFGDSRCEPLTLSLAEAALEHHSVPTE
jgi:hypothetical protein